MAVHGEALDAADKVCRADLLGATQIDGLSCAGHPTEVHWISVEGQSPVGVTLETYIEESQVLQELSKGQHM